MADTESFLQVAAEVKELATIRRFVEEKAMAFTADPSIVNDIVLAVNEAATNVIVHGYQGRPGLIEIKIKREGDALLLFVRDQAVPFDPTRVPPPDITLPLEKRPPGGMGVHLIRHLMDAMFYRLLPDGSNELTLVKNGIG
jgi:serine/threonine-protein kinase RsbW